MKFIKVFFVILNTVHTIAGAIIFSFGVRHLIKLNEEDESLNIERFGRLPVSTYLAVGCGAFLIFDGIIGYIAVYSQKPYFLSLYSSLLSFPLAILIVEGIYTMVPFVKDESPQEIEQTLRDTWTHNTSIFHNIEEKYKCCGLNGQVDYESITAIGICKDNNTETMYEQGCINAVKTAYTNVTRFKLIFQCSYAAWLILIFIVIPSLQKNKIDSENYKYDLPLRNLRTGDFC